MARRRRSKSDDKSGREFQTITRTEVLPPTNLRILEDRREWNPLLEEAPAAVFFEREARRVVPTRPRVSRPSQARSIEELLPHGLQFNVPEEVLVCVRRKRRREVLFATRRYGRNGAKRYRRNRFSEVSCSQR